MAYTVDVDPEAREQIGALPSVALTALAEAMTVLTLTPWNGDPINKENPDGAVRVLLFNPRGMITTFNRGRSAPGGCTPSDLGQLTIYRHDRENQSRRADTDSIALLNLISVQLVGWLVSIVALLENGQG